MSEPAPQPESLSVAPVPQPIRGPGRLQTFGRRALATVLLVIFLLWLEELFADPQTRQGWKLKVMMVLIPLGLAGTTALLLAWRRERQNRRPG